MGAEWSAGDLLTKDSFIYTMTSQTFGHVAIITPYTLRWYSAVTENN